VFENLHLSDGEWLGHVQPRRRPKVEFLGHGHEATELAQVEHPCVPGIGEPRIFHF
jgi:hypothetical protein